MLSQWFLEAEREYEEIMRKWFLALCYALFLELDREICADAEEKPDNDKQLAG